MKKSELECGTFHLNSLAQRLNAICRTATLDFTLKVGSLVIDELYDGDIEAWQRERGRRMSYRALMSRGDLVISATTLSRSVGAYVLLRRLQRDWQHLSISHLHEVLPLEAAKQEALLERAETEAWSVAHLRQEIRLLRPSSSMSHKADCTNPLLTELSSKLVGHFEVLENGAMFDLDDAAAQRARESIASLRRDLQRLEGLLSQREARGQVARSERVNSCERARDGSERRITLNH